MTSTAQDFNWRIGDDCTKDFYITDSAGDPLNMTGYTAAWVMYDGNGDAVLSKDTDDGIAFADGNDTKDIFRLTLEDTDGTSLSAGIYGHQGEVKDGSGNHVTTFEGKAKLYADHATAPSS